MNKLEQIIQLVESGERPIIRFLESSGSGGLERGQYCCVIDHNLEEDEQFNVIHIVHILTLDFSEFWQYNQQIALPIYYNHETQIWDALLHKTKGYPADYRATYYLDESQCDEFEIVDYNDYNFGIHRAFINSVKRFEGTPNAVDNYQEWLEDNLISVLIESDNIDALRDGELPW